MTEMTRHQLGDRFADWMQIPRHPGLDESIAAGWPEFVKFRESLLPVPLAPQGYWAFDEFLRQGMLFFLSSGKPISIEIPETNRP